MQPFRMILGLVVTGILFWSPISGHAQNKYPTTTKGEVFHVVSTRNEISLTEKFSRVLELDSRVTRVDGFDPAVVTAVALTPHRIRIQAVAFGVTTLVLVDEFDKTYTIDVFVEGDVRHLQSYISRLYPDSSVTALKVDQSIILRGVVADPSHIANITELTELFFPNVLNQMTFGAANQVRLQVRIMEAQRSKIRQLGFNWSLLNNGGYISSNPGNLATPSGVTLNGGGPNTVTYGSNGLSGSSMSFGLVNANYIFRGFLEALKEEGLLRVLNETSIVADSGRPASLHSGGEFPILVPQSLGTLSVEWREFGVKLEAVPIVLGNGEVILELAPEFSERDFANAASLNNTTIPAIISRKVNTQVRMKLGQTLMIGGLIATRHTAETDKTPFLGELPYVGAAFRRVRYDETETELIILVTPQYVAPLNPDQVPAGGPGMFSDVPTDRELFGQGLIEVPNYGGPTPPMPSNFGPHESLKFSGARFSPAPNQFSPQVRPQITPQINSQFDESLDQQLPPIQMMEKGLPRYLPEESFPPQGLKKGETMPLLPTPLPAQPKELKMPPKLPAPPVSSSDEKRGELNSNVTSSGDFYQSRRGLSNRFNSQIRPATAVNQTRSQYRTANQKSGGSSVPPTLITPTFRQERPTSRQRFEAPNP